MKTEFFYNELLKEKYSLTVLDNGLKIYICEKPEFDSFYAVYGTKYGSIDTAFSLNGEEPKEVPAGIAHFLEHKLFESEDGDAFTKYAKTGANANAYTSFDRTCYLFSCSKDFEENLEILLNFVQNPYFTQETVDKEQGIIGQEITMYDDSPAWCVFFNLLEAMYHNNPVRIDIAGTKETISKIDAELLHRCYNTFYNPSNMFICLAGNVNTKNILSLIKQRIKPSIKNEITRKRFSEPQSVKQGYIEKKLDVAMPLFNYGFKLKPTQGFSMRDNIYINLLLNTVAGDMSSLYKRLTDEKLINDEFETEYFYGRDFSAAIFSGESSNPKMVAEIINREIERVKISGIDSKIFEAARRSMYGSLVKRCNSVEGTVSSFVDAAVMGYEVFEEIELVKSATALEAQKYLEGFSLENTVLSQINPMEEK